MSLLYEELFFYGSVQPTLASRQAFQLLKLLFDSFTTFLQLYCVLLLSHVSYLCVLGLFLPCSSTPIFLFPTTTPGRCFFSSLPPLYSLYLLHAAAAAASSDSGLVLFLLFQLHEKNTLVQFTSHLFFHCFFLSFFQILYSFPLSFTVNLDDVFSFLFFFFFFYKDVFFFFSFSFCMSCLFLFSFSFLIQSLVILPTHLLQYTYCAPC